MKAIVLVANYERTSSVNQIALKIRKNRSDIYLICVVWDELARSIINYSYFDQVIDVANADSTISIQPSFDACSILEKDRMLDINEVNIQHVFSVAHHVESSLSMIKEAIVFGEVSWAYEEIVMKISEKKGYKYYTPVASRIFDRSWFMSQALSEVNFYKPVISNVCTINSIDSALEDFKPDYFSFGMDNLKFSNRFKRFKVTSLINCIKSKKYKRIILAKINYFICKPLSLLCKMRTSIRDKKNKYILFPFHVQPEASIDYLAPDFNDQYLVALQIAKNLPYGYKLVLKDHPGSVVELNPLVKLRLLINRDIVYLKTAIDVYEIADELYGCVVISSTVGLQLAMRGVPTVSLIDIFFNNHPLCKKSTIPSIAPILEKLHSIRNSQSLEAMNSDFVNELKKYSIPGYSFNTNEYGFVDPLYIDNCSKVLVEIYDECSPPII